MSLFKKKNLVGLDIGSFAVKVVELIPKKKGGREIYELSGLGYEPLPPQTIVEGAIMDYTSLADTINKVFSNAHIKNKNVAIGLSGTAVITRKLILQKMSEEELEESIEFEAKGQLTSPITDVYLDYDVVNEDEERMEVVLVAIKREKVDEYRGAVIQAGKNVEVVDTDHFALQNAVEFNYSIPPDTTYAIINVGASLTNIVIVRNGAPILTRDVNLGGANLTDVIQKEFHLDFEKAEKIKKGQTVSGISSEVVEPSLQVLFNDLKMEILKTFDYYQAISVKDNISKIYLSGGSAKMKNLSSFLEEELKTPIELVNPFQNIYYNEKKFNSDYLNEMESTFVVAVGLAMRKMGE